MQNRRRTIQVGFVLFLMVVSGFDAHGAAKVKPVVGMKAWVFGLEEVRLLAGPFKEARERDRAYLLRLEPDRLLHRFRKFAGLEPKGEIYGGWEKATISGHSLGHYLSASAMMYASTGDTQLRDKVNYIIDELALCQEKHGDGYVAGFPNGRKVFAEIAKGDIRSKGFDLNGLWVPWYTQHKLFAGLFDAYRYCENIKALAELYALTGEKKYLELSRRFHHEKVLGPLAQGIDCLPGIHANTQFPKVIGVARRYELTGDERDRRIAEFFWDRVVKRSDSK